MNIKIQTIFKAGGSIYYQKNIKIFAVLVMMINLYIAGEVQKLKIF
jgi:hypothetical protein